MYTSLVKLLVFHAFCQFCTVPWKDLSEFILSWTLLMRVCLGKIYFALYEISLQMPGFLL